MAALPNWVEDTNSSGAERHGSHIRSDAGDRHPHARGNAPNAPRWRFTPGGTPVAVPSSCELLPEACDVRVPPTRHHPFGQRHAILPKPIRDALGWNAGTRLAVEGTSEGARAPPVTPGC